LQHRNTRLAGDEDWRPLSLEEVRKVHIQKVLQMCNGNRLRAAQILGIGRTSLYRYLKRDGYDVRPHSSVAAA
jgi:transcriptional regulator of acetoin/glycerol metabolism